MGAPTAGCRLPTCQPGRFLPRTPLPAPPSGARGRTSRRPAAHPLRAHSLGSHKVTTPATPAASGSGETLQLPPQHPADQSSGREPGDCLPALPAFNGCKVMAELARSSTFPLTQRGHLRIHSECCHRPGGCYFYSRTLPIFKNGGSCPRGALPCGVT